MEQNEFNFEPINEVKGDSIPERFKRFHAANPHVYDAIPNTIIDDERTRILISPAAARFYRTKIASTSVESY